MKTTTHFAVKNMINTKMEVRKIKVRQSLLVRRVDSSGLAAAVKGKRTWENESGIIFARVDIVWATEKKPIV